MSSHPWNPPPDWLESDYSDIYFEEEYQEDEGYLEEQEEQEEDAQELGPDREAEVGICDSTKAMASSPLPC